MRRLATALAGALLLAGCPIPQPLPEYDAGTITPPRIVMNDATAPLAFPETVVLVPAYCPTTAQPSYPLTATLIDANLIEPVSARWFVNYDPTLQARYTPEHESVIAGDSSATVTRRTVPSWTFCAYGGYGTVAGTAGGSESIPGAVQIVELVVSNGFDATAIDTSVPLPYRTPLPTFETQIFRWVFVTTDAVTCN